MSAQARGSGPRGLSCSPGRVLGSPEPLWGGRLARGVFSSFQFGRTQLPVWLRGGLFSICSGPGSEAAVGNRTVCLRPRETDVLGGCQRGPLDPVECHPCSSHDSRHNFLSRSAALNIMLRRPLPSLSEQRTASEPHSRSPQLESLRLPLLPARKGLGFSPSSTAPGARWSPKLSCRLWAWEPLGCGRTGCLSSLDPSREGVLASGNAC